MLLVFNLNIIAILFQTKSKLGQVTVVLLQIDFQIPFRILFENSQKMK